MKKFISFVLGFAIMLSMGTVVFAVETNNTILTYTNEASYEISIPSEASIDKNTGRGTIVMSITNTNLAEGMEIAVSVSSSNFVFGEEGEDEGGNSYSGMWYLINTEEPTDKLAYMMRTDDKENYLSSGDVVFGTDGPTDWNLYIQLAENAKVGSYTDTLTFTSEILDLIEFSINDEFFTAKRGMTWEEFVDSNYNPTYICPDCGDEFKVFEYDDWEYDGGILFVGAEGALCPDSCGGYEGYINGGNVNRDSKIIDGEDYYLG